MAPRRARRRDRGGPCAVNFAERIRGRHGIANDHAGRLDQPGPRHDRDRDVTVQAVVTAGAGLLDSTGRRIVIQDATAAIEVLLPKDVTPPGVGTGVRVMGRVGTAHGAPRLRAVSLVTTGADRHAHRARGPRRSDGRPHVAARRRGRSGRGRPQLGERWRAEMTVGAERWPSSWASQANIPVDRLVEGAPATVTGIVRPAVPGAADRRPALLPRTPADVEVRAVAAHGSGGEPVVGAAAGASTRA